MNLTPASLESFFWMMMGAGSMFVAFIAVRALGKRWEKQDTEERERAAKVVRKVALPEDSEQG